MSYSFSVRAATKAELKVKIAAELDKVVAGQPAHARDRVQAQAAADAFVDVIDADETRDVVVTVNGSVSGQWQPDNTLTSLSGASVSISAALATKVEAS
ncbi:MAG: hypothetical protein ABI433_00970 [Burkholderiaceae bacterium]